MTVLLIIVGSGVATLVGLFAFVYWSATRLPDNHPAAYLAAGGNAPPGQKVLVCVGDSITHGRVGCNYVDMVRERLGSDFVVINAGINSEHAYNVLQRLDDIIQCKPDFVTILIGTNDCKGAFDDQVAAKTMKEMRLPERPTKAVYERNLFEICRRLRAETNACVAVHSIPIMSETPESFEFRASQEYATVAKAAADLHQATYIPLNETLAAYLREHSTGQTPTFPVWEKVMSTTIFRHYLLREGWDQLAARFGFVLLTDHIHLNCTAAAMVADGIVDFVASGGSAPSLSA